MLTKATAPGPTRELALTNRQHARRIQPARLLHVLRCLLDHGFDLRPYSLAFHLVDASTISRLNRDYLSHDRATDVLTFDLREPGTSGVCGEIFICVPVAVAQARRFRTSWQTEVVRYAVHGVLHLLGYDDRSSLARRRMKTEEDRWVRRLSRTNDLKSIAGKPILRRSAPQRRPRSNL